MPVRNKRPPVKREPPSTSGTEVRQVEPRTDLPTDAIAKELRPEWLDGLTPVEDRFCAEFLAHRCSGADAVLAVRPGISRNAARVAAHRLLQRPEIQARIKGLHEEFQAEAQFTAKRVYLELARIARADVRGLYDEDGNLRPVHDLDDDTAAAVAGIEVHEDFLGTEGGDKVPVGQTTKIKLRNKLEALKALGEYHGMFRNNASKAVVMIVNIKI